VCTIVGGRFDWLGDAVTWPRWWAIDLAFGVAASTAAIVAFAYWVLEQRRRPEIRFLWRYATSESDGDLVNWDTTEYLPVGAGSTLLIEASVRNVGDASAQRALTNFVAPTSAGDLKRVPTIVGGASIAFLVQEFQLPPSEWFLQRFVLELPDHEARLRLTFKLTDNRLNSSGRRWLPSRLAGVDEPDSEWGERWPPPRPQIRQQWSRIRALPKDRPWCVKGERQDIRDLLVVGQDPPGEKAKTSEE
jgi:hypothetical protein